MDSMKVIFTRYFIVEIFLYNIVNSYLHVVLGRVLFCSVCFTRLKYVHFLLLKQQKKKTECHCMGDL